VTERGGWVCLGKGCELRKNMPLTECGVGRRTGWPQEKSNLKKSKQSVKKGREGLTLRASQWHCHGVEECRKPRKGKWQWKKKKRAVSKKKSEGLTPGGGNPT